MSDKKCFIVCDDGNEIVMEDYSFAIMLSKYFDAECIKGQYELTRTQSKGYGYWTLDPDKLNMTFSTVQCGTSQGGGFGDNGDFGMICLGVMHKRAGINMFVTAGSADMTKLLTMQNISWKYVRPWKFKSEAAKVTNADTALVQEMYESVLLHERGVYGTRALRNGESSSLYIPDTVKTISRLMHELDNVIVVVSEALSFEGA